MRKCVVQGFRLDLGLVLKSLGFGLRSFSSSDFIFEGVKGIMEVEPGNRFVAYCDKLPISERRFVVAHELAHFHLHGLDGKIPFQSEKKRKISYSYNKYFGGLVNDEEILEARSRLR